MILLTVGAFALGWLNSANARRQRQASELSDADLARQFNQTIRPLLTTYCAGCHSGNEAAASLDLQRYVTLESVVNDFSHWQRISRQLSTRAMPPKEMKQPAEAAREQVIEWIAAVRKNELRKHANDPGPVTARRLSNAEYDYTVRDLTGVDLRPAREFPLDPTNEAGFANSGESLTLSPALLSKYLDAARRIADHLVLKPDTIDFAEQPMLVESDREKYPIRRIVEFYDRQPTDFADYFLAAWHFKQRKGGATLNAIAIQQKISPRYLSLIWQTLEQTKEDVGPLVKLQAMWRALPANDVQAARKGCEQMRDFVVRIRRHTERLFPTLASPGFATNYQPIVMYRNGLLAAHRRDFEPAALRNEGEAAKDFVVTEGPPFGGGEIRELKANIATYIKERNEDPDLIVPVGQRAKYEAAFARFSRVFPTAFCLKERGRFYPINTMDRERYLGAGLHSALGYFRDDTPLIELILDDKGKHELETLWHEFEFIGDYTLRNYTQFIGTNARRVADKRESSQGFAAEAAIIAQRDLTLRRTNAETDPRIFEAIRQYFDNANTRIRAIEKARLAAEPRQLESLLQFAARAYRRPLQQTERDELLAYYRQVREQNRLSHEEAMRATLTSVLVSPDFLFRLDRVNATTKANGNAPLSANSLANRLSYFLWSSLPDDELLAHAAAGDLTKPAVLLAQTRRMLKDERARRLATEFGGNWLDFRRFENHNAVDRARFPAFTNQLRAAMYEEPIRFLTDVMQRDLPVQELLYGKHTFVNGVLARHYGMPAKSEDWQRVDNAHEYGRGGLLPMAVFLTQNAPGQRTSPVKRGYWVVRRVLGEMIPPPPPTVAELPADEAKTSLPLRELLAQHRNNKACAGCHARFDAFGLVFEGYGPTGERRTNDLAGRAIDARAAFADNTQAEGIAGLQAYLRARREQDFLNTLSEKLLAFALGRSLQLSDEPLLETMKTKLAANGYKPSALIETIVTSPQFLNKRRGM
jgi:hypothetical protein